MAGTDASVAVDRVWPDVAAALPAAWQVALAGAVQWTGRVWKITLADGRALALKLANEWAPVAREAAALAFLAGRGCAVPRVIAERPGWLVTEWCGDDTLDDALQRGGAVDGVRLVRSVRAVSAALGEVTSWSGSARATLVADLDAWTSTLPLALEWLGAAPAAGPLERVIERAMSCDPVPGSLDYTARNVVLASAGPVLLDFSSIGFDWDERRLAQYSLSAGAARPDARFASALSRTVVGGAWDSEGIDSHEVLLLLIAAEQLRHVEAGTAHPARVAAWRDSAARKSSLLHLLRRRLCSVGPAEQLRATLR